jgi:flagellar basal-body rod protein FlgB
MDSIDTSLNNHQKTAETLEVALKGLSMRSQAMSGNIANINTPGYKRRTLDFEQTLMNQIQKGSSYSDIAMEKTHEDHFSNAIFEINQIKDNMAMEISHEESFHNNGNNVDIDREMIELTKTGLKFKALSKMTSKYYQLTRGIIRGG